VRHTAEKCAKPRSRTEPVAFEIDFEECKVSTDDTEINSIKQRLSKQRSAITLDDIKQKLSRAEAQRAKAKQERRSRKEESQTRKASASCEREDKILSDRLEKKLSGANAQRQKELSDKRGRAEVYNKRVQERVQSATSDFQRQISEKQTSLQSRLLNAATNRGAKIHKIRQTANRFAQPRSTSLV